MNTKSVIIIGYSGHAYVIADIFRSQAINIFGYCDVVEKIDNPYQLVYLGNEKEIATLDKLKEHNYFPAIGNNKIRKSVIEFVEKQINQRATNAIHRTAYISKTANLAHGIMVNNNAQINALSKIGRGVICNTSSIIEHECSISAFSHIAPGAVLCGNVSIGENTFVGARSVIKQGISIGSNVIIGAGSVVISDIPDNQIVVGNPHRSI